mmetsp:Transcript_9047/g.33360  ORF Transcript_9047/g.33360 Transcript_9047/m.33360 type:complete len:102 (+) Transcript_9047:527-832(+)
MSDSMRSCMSFIMEPIPPNPPSKNSSSKNDLMRLRDPPPEALGWRLERNPKLESRPKKSSSKNESVSEVGPVRLDELWCLLEEERCESSRTRFTGISESSS